MYFNVSQQMTPSPKVFLYSMPRGAVLNLRHHIYAIGTCECERSLEKSLIWASKVMEPKKPMVIITDCRIPQGGPDLWIFTTI